MTRWKSWFKAVAPQTGENAGLRSAREVSPAGVQPLPWTRDALTGYTIVNAEDMDAAEAMARTNPVRELASH